MSEIGKSDGICSQITTVKLTCMISVAQPRKQCPNCFAS